MPVVLEPALAAAFALVALAVRRRFGWGWLLWLALGVLWASLAIDARIADRLSPELQGADLAVSGWVDEFPAIATGQVSFSFRVDSTASTGGVPRRLRLTWYDPPPDAVEPGSVLDLVVRLKQY